MNSAWKATFSLMPLVLAGCVTASEWEAGQRFRDCPECPEMVVVPAGSFMMGSPESEAGRSDDEGPVHEVTIGLPFAMGVYEVTVSEFGRFVDATGHSTGDACHMWTDSPGEFRNGMGWRNPGFEQGGGHPVVCVSWYDAEAYAGWLSRRTGERYRLPSEAEWEYAARAGTTGPFHTGSTISTDQANYNGHQPYGSGRKGIDRGRTVSVGSFGANRFGLHDMHGNVLEWVQDYSNFSYAHAPDDGRAYAHAPDGSVYKWGVGISSFRVLRGGSWHHFPMFLRSAHRFRLRAVLRDNFNGFRVARTLRP